MYHVATVLGPIQEPASVYPRLSFTVHLFSSPESFYPAPHRQGPRPKTLRSRIPARGRKPPLRPRSMRASRPGQGEGCAVRALPRSLEKPAVLDPSPRRVCRVPSPGNRPPQPCAPFPRRGDSTQCAGTAFNGTGEARRPKLRPSRGLKHGTMGRGQYRRGAFRSSSRWALLGKVEIPSGSDGRPFSARRSRPPLMPGRTLSAPSFPGLTAVGIGTVNPSSACR